MVTQIGQNETQKVKKEKWISEPVSFSTFFIMRVEQNEKVWNIFFKKVNKQTNK